MAYKRLASLLGDLSLGSDTRTKLPHVYFSELPLASRDVVARQGNRAQTLCKLDLEDHQPAVTEPAL